MAEAERSLPDRAVGLLRPGAGVVGGARRSVSSPVEWWALAESTRLAELRVVAREELAAALMAIGHHARAVPDLWRG